MSYFEYRALYADGRQDNGTLETDSIEQAAANLRQRGLMVVSLQETANPENIGSVTNRRWIHRAAWLLPILARDRATFFRQMSMMVQTGLTLLQALQICKKESVKKAFRNVI
jgi:general secretion pathway protein F